MKVFFSTDWTLNDSIITEDSNNIITLHNELITWGQSKGNVCLIASKESGEIIATSGCGEEEPLITERFIRFWAESGFPSEMDIEISELYLEDFYKEIRDDEVNYFDFINNPVNEILLGEPKELVLFSENLDKLMDEQVESWEENYQSSQITQDALDKMEHEARQNLRKHKLVKRKDLPKRVDFSLLPNASGIIWSALTLLKDGAIDINHEIYQNAVKTANNLDLFMQNMKNPKFATRASFEIEKILSHGKN